MTGLIPLPGLEVQVTRVGLVGAPSASEAVVHLRSIGVFGDAWKWTVGDLILAACSERPLAEVLSEVAGLGLDDRSALSWYYAVSKNVAPAQRVETLKWAYHREVVALPPELQADWLAKALECGWSIRTLHDRITDAYAPPADDEPAPTLLPRVPRRTLTAVATAVEDLWAAEASPSPVTVILLPDGSWRLGANTEISR